MSLLGLVSSGRKSKLGKVSTSNSSGRNRYVRADASRLIYESLESRQLMAGVPEMIELAFDSNSISQITSVGSDVYFVASTQEHGKELWKVDAGSPTGATMVKDIQLGSNSSNPDSLTNVNGTLFFSADDGANGYELWSSNGTPGGTSIVKDIFPGNIGSVPQYLTNVNGTLFFRARDFNGSELWSSNGTAAGTTIVKDIGTSGSYPYSLTNVNGTLFFITYFGAELWSSNGTAAGTTLVKDIRSGSGSSYPKSLTDVNGTLFFTAKDALIGRELWSSNGTAAGTTIVKDIKPGSEGSNPGNLTNVNGTLFFSASNHANGSELWSSNGTAAGTTLVKDIVSGNASSNPGNLTNVNGTLFFSAFDNTNGTELWSSNGTAAGTTIVKDIRSGFYGSYPRSLTNVSGTLFFDALDNANGTELWSSNGTAAGTTIAQDIQSGIYGSNPASLTNVNGLLFFSANNGANGYELWSSNGIAVGTLQLTSESFQSESSSSPSHFTEVNGVTFFVATTPKFGSELWKTNGTAAGTTLVKDIRAGIDGSSPRSLTNVNGTLFFSANNGANGVELWSSNGTAAGTTIVKDIRTGISGSNPQSLTNVNGTLFFSANNGANGVELWSSNGTVAGTTLVQDIQPGIYGSYPQSLTNVNGTIFFNASDVASGSELWSSNGTAAGTTLVKDIQSVAYYGSNPVSLTNFNGTLFFGANKGVNGYELWSSNGTAAGTTIIQDMQSGSTISSPRYLTNVSGILFFQGFDNTNGYELWSSNGTAAGTFLVKDIQSGYGSSIPRNLTNVNGTLFFSANNGANGYELWSSNGTAVGTTLVKDIRSGSSSSHPLDLTNVNGNLFFSANNNGVNGASGNDLWSSNGTTAGTTIVEDIQSGGNDSNPRYLTNVNGTLFFSADDGVNGNELWVLKSNVAPTVVNPIADLTVNEDAADLTIDLTNVFADIDSNFLYSAVSNNGSLVTAAVSGSDLTLSFVGNANGATTVTVTASDGSLTVSDTFAVTVTAVNDAPTVASPLADVTVEKNSDDLTIDLTGVFADIDSSLTYSAVSDNGALVTAAVSGSDLTLSFIGNANGATTVTVTANDGSLTVSDTFAVTVTMAGPAEMIELAFDSNSISQITAVGSDVFFVASTSGKGNELWKVDSGSVTGATLVKDIRPGINGSYPQSLTNVNGTLFFAADNGISGFELWSSNGTAAGTTMVQDSRSGSDGSNPQFLTNVNGTLFFSAIDDMYGNELWSSNGTLAGTSIAKDIQSGSNGSGPRNLTNVNGTLFFIAYGPSGDELWSSNGTVDGTKIVKDIRTGIASSMRYLTNVNGTLFFSISEGDNAYYSGTELWSSNGTLAGTNIVKEFQSGQYSTWPKSLTNVNGTLFFTAYDDNGTELWSSNGTPGGTSVVKDIIPGINGLSPRYLTNVNGTLFFSAYDDEANGLELWSSDGTAAGTNIVKDIQSGSGSSYPTNLTNVNGTLFFRANDGISGDELWSSNGTLAGTTLVKDIQSGSSGTDMRNLTNVDGTLFFSAYDDANGIELWFSNGVTAGTLPTTSGSFVSNASSSPSLFTEVNGVTFFVANTPQLGTELWKTDGTLAGTTLIKDIRSGSGFSSNPTHLTNVNGTLFFLANDGMSGTELWSSDGTLAGTNIVKDITPDFNGPSPRYLTNINGILFFRANDGINGYELWSSDGTLDGTKLVKDISGSSVPNPTNLTNVNGTLFFGAGFFGAGDSVNGQELWSSDGTLAGTNMVKNIRSGNLSSNPRNLTNVNGTLFFSAHDGVNGYELWSSDGTLAGTNMVKNIRSGSASSYPTNLTNVDGTLFFSANDGTNGIELWSSNGTATGTALVQDIRSGSSGSYPRYLTNINGTLFFSALYDANDIELWSSDGTLAGTNLVKDIRSGSGRSYPTYLTNVNGTLFFRANDGINGAELWSSDGTHAGTTLFKDIRSGSSGSYPRYLTNINGTLFFTAYSDASGFELWVLRNPTPSDINVSVSSIAENLPSGSVIGQFTSVDSDVDDAFYYTLVPGDGDVDNASFTIDGDQLLAAASFDFETKASYSIRVRTTDLAGLTFEKSFTISVTDVAESIAPVIGAFDTTVTFTENGTPVLLDTNATLTDADSLDFVGGVMTVSLITNSEDSDRLLIRNQGTGAGQIGVSGAEVTFAGIAIATFVGGASGDDPLTITLGAGGSKVAAQALLRNITFSSVSDSPSTLPRTVQVLMTDGDGGESLPVTKTINVNAVNDAPVIANFAAVASYTEGDAPVLLGSATTVADLDSADFAAGVLTVRVLVNSQTTDRLSIRNDGTAPGDIGVSGTNVLYGNVAIGSFTGTTTLTITLNANATAAAVQALLRNVTFHSISLAPSTLTRTVSAALTDGDGGTSATVTTSVNVIAMNTAPTLGAFDPAVTYVENAAPILLDANATVSDVDSSDLDGGILSVTLTNNSENDDRLAVRNQGLAANQVGVIGNQLSFGGTSIGMIYGGTSGSDPLQIEFNDNATPAAVQAVLRNITFNNVSQNPSTLPRTVEVQLTDGDGGTSDPVTKTINVTSVNNAPVISNFEGVVSYTEGDEPVLLAVTASVFDVDSTDFDLGRLTVSVSDNTQTTDRITITNEGIAPGQIGVSGSAVTYGGTVIGTFTGTTSLIVTLNANASQAAVEALVANIAFSSLSNAPSTLLRTISARLTDGDGGTSATVTKTVQIVSTNDAPVINAFDTAVTYVENGVPVVLDTNATVVDTDLLDFEDGVLTVSLIANGSADDRLEIRNQGVGANQIGVNVDEVTFGGVVIGTFSGGTSGSEPLEILLNVSANQAAVQALVRNLTFRNVSESPSTLVRTVEMQLTDGDGGSSVPVTKSINVTAVNDAPVITNFIGISSYTEDDIAVAIAIDSVVDDLDSTDFDLGRLIASVSANSQSTDRITIRNDGILPGQIGVSGTSVTYSGIVIGTFAGTTTLTVTLNAAADKAAVQALLRNISFSSISQAPSTLQRTIRATLSDGDGGTSLAVTTLVDVVAVNDAPVVGAFTPDVTYVENAAHLLIDSNATVTDIDSADFADGFMTVSLTANGHADDRLSIRNQGLALNQIGVAGGQVTYSGIVIATFVGGTSGLDPLQITFNAVASKAAVQALVRNLTFSNVSDNPSTLPRTVSLTVNDGDGGTSTEVTKTINVTAVNDAPTIGGFDGNVGYAVGGPAVALDSDATVEDPDTGTFNLGVLTVSLTTNRQTTDRIEILSVGTGLDEISVLNNQVFYEGVLIGTFGGTTTLTVTLNDNASKAAVQKLLRSITFRSLSATPSLLSRTVSVRLSDSAGGTSIAQTKTIDMV